MPNFVVDDFEVSYGDPQTVQVNARRDLGAITLRYRVNGGKVQKKSTREWQGGLRYGDEGDYGTTACAGRSPGRTPATKWRSGTPRRRAIARAARSPTRCAHSNADVLVLAVEDYSGNSALPPSAT